MTCERPGRPEIRARGGDDDARTRAERAGQEDRALGPDEAAGTHGRPPRGDGPGVVRLPGGGTLESAKQDRRATSGSDSEHEPPGRALEHDPLSARLGEERERHAASTPGFVAVADGTAAGGAAAGASPRGDAAQKTATAA